MFQSSIVRMVLIHEVGYYVYNSHMYITLWMFFRHHLHFLVNTILPPVRSSRCSSRCMTYVPFTSGDTVAPYKLSQRQFCMIVRARVSERSLTYMNVSFAKLHIAPGVLMLERGSFALVIWCASFVHISQTSPDASHPLLLIFIC